MLCSNLSWSAYCKYASAKVSKSLNFLRHTLQGATTEAKSMTYKYLVHSSLEYASVVWSPHTVSDKATVKSVQQRAAQWACESRWSLLQNQWSKSSNVCLQELHWPTLSSHRNYLNVSMMYDILHGQYNSLITVLSIHLVLKHTRYPFFHHNLQSILIDTLFVNTAFLWNTVPHTILTLDSPKFRHAQYRFFVVFNF